MRAIILSIGDELTLGQTVDTNSAWISRQLAAVGCNAVRHLTVGDAQSDIESAIRDAVPLCDFLICSGGIGPTEDDLTRQALAAVMGMELELDAAWMARLEEFFRKLNRPMSPLNSIQAMVPRGATLIENTVGTAAGITATIQASADRATSLHGVPLECRIFCMPGVPKEMKVMFTRDVLPHVQAAGGGAVILSRTLHTFGMGESNVADLLKAHGDLMQRDRNPSVGTTVSEGVVSLRLNARFPSADQAARELNATEASCRAALGDLIYGQDHQTLPAVVAGLLFEDPLARKWAPAVATAESCTGGLLAKYLTDIPGSSRYFRQGYITYQNEAKTNLIGVPAELLAEHGAVSEPVAEAMAKGAQCQSGAAFALAITGIAGPGGGTLTKPVGTVCIALASPQRVQVRTFVFSGDREMIRDRSAKMALTLLRFQLLGKPVPF
jgi:nicotinamide-nucleotide amidase